MSSTKVKTSITLERKLHEATDQCFSNRSKFLEQAARSYLRELRRAEGDADDRKATRAG